MHTDEYYQNHDFRWEDSQRERITWKETLMAMCNYYGNFSGRWHDNAFWAKTRKEIKNMTEEQAEIKVREIEKEADTRLEEWRFCN